MPTALDLPGADPEALARTVLGLARRFQSILGSELFITAVGCASRTAGSSMSTSSPCGRIASWAR